MSEKDSNFSENPDGKILVQCAACGKLIRCSSMNSDTLFKHIIKYHKEIPTDYSEAPDFNESPKSDTNKSSVKPSKNHSQASEATSSNPHNNEGNEPLLKESKNEADTEAEQSQWSCRLHRYCKYIKNWCFPSGLLYCPKCDSWKRPNRQERCCFLSSTRCCKYLKRCWPLCLICSEPKIELSCQKCGILLAFYYPESNEAKPRNDFVDVKEK